MFSEFLSLTIGESFVRITPTLILSVKVGGFGLKIRFY